MKIMAGYLRKPTTNTTDGCDNLKILKLVDKPPKQSLGNLRHSEIAEVPQLLIDTLQALKATFQVASVRATGPTPDSN
jgi:hypothetical protein